MEKLNNFELFVNYGSHILLSHFPSICTLDRLYIHLVQVNPDKKYRSLPGISVVLSVILSRNHSRSFYLSWNLLFWPWKWKYRSFASSVLILLNLFSKSMILTKYFCAKLQYFRIFKLIWESFYWLMSVLLRISVSWKNGIFRIFSKKRVIFERKYDLNFA